MGRVIILKGQGSMADAKRFESISAHMKERARKPRCTTTIPERLMWALLRDLRFQGHKFRRSQPHEIAGLPE